MVCSSPSPFEPDFVLATCFVVGAGLDFVPRLVIGIGLGGFEPEFVIGVGLGFEVVGDAFVLGVD